MIKNIFFDLDGTLLPMDQDKFTKGYFSRLVKRVAPLGYEPQRLIDSVWRGTAAMVKNTGHRTNEEAFWQEFRKIYGDKGTEDKPVFDDFYKTDFGNVKEDCGFNPKAGETVKKLKADGFNLILATNPIFPSVATESRIGWSGVDKNDFLIYTTYEKSHYCKPNPKYYEEILDKLNLKAEESLMVGNDIEEDMIARTLGMQVFLLTDCLINKKDRDIAAYPSGSFDELYDYISKNR